MRSKDRLLIVAQAFPPVGGSHVTRIKAFADYLGVFYNCVGFSIKVDSGYPIYDETQKASIPIIRIFPGFVHNIAHRKSDIGAKVSGRAGSVDIRNIIKRYAAHLYRKIEIVDSYFEWVPFLAFVLRRRIQMNDLVLSSSMPNSTHIGVLIALIGKNNFWIADFGDPWSLDKSRCRKGFKALIERVIEFCVMKRANLIAFTTEATKMDYQKYYPSFAKKMTVIRMGYDDTDCKIEPILMEGKNVFYGGSLPVENRNFEEFKYVINQNPNVNFIFSGASISVIKDTYSNNIPFNVQLIEWLSHESFIRMLKSCDVSVIFGNNNYQQIPGKVYHYLAHAKSILYIGAMEPSIDESLSVLGGGCEFSFNDRVSINNKLHKMLDDSSVGNSRETSAYSWSKITKGFVDQIERRRKISDA